MAKKISDVRPAWIGHWISAVITRFSGYDKEEGKYIDLQIQSSSTSTS